ncbi:hypothetical protein N867_06915 [Actinotalea fermentans ATCC 43279 = JCM 9966 = DSM 3133]|nr:hypothetical protein N867_06915 [Actinotalea fermentans ATCC 43279 = JCM 9966 = DSM 3133]
MRSTGLRVSLLSCLARLNVLVLCSGGTSSMSAMPRSRSFARLVKSWEMPSVTAEQSSDVSASTATMPMSVSRDRDHMVCPLLAHVPDTRHARPGALWLTRDFRP